MSETTEAMERLLIAAHKGEVIAGVFDLVRVLDMPEPNRGHLAGIANRYGQTPKGRRRIAVAIFEAAIEHFEQSHTGGIGSVTEYMSRVISMGGVAPAAREARLELTTEQRDAIAGLNDLGYTEKDATKMIMEAFRLDAGAAAKLKATELVSWALRQLGVVKGD